MARHTVGIGWWPGCVGFYSCYILILVLKDITLLDFYKFLLVGRTEKW